MVILNEDSTDAVRSGMMRLHQAVQLREPARPESALSPEDLLALFQAADPTRNAACLPWLLRTYAACGYRLEDLGKARDTLQNFARFRHYLENTTTRAGEVRNPRKLGSHMGLTSLWSAVAPFVEADRLEREEGSEEYGAEEKERALAQSRVLHRSERMVVAVPLTEEASCWWGRGTQWCTAAQNNNAFDNDNSNSPLIVVCLENNGELPRRKLQLYVYSTEMQFVDENDILVDFDLITERWQELSGLLHWAIAQNGLALQFVPEHLRDHEMCMVAVGGNGRALEHVPQHLRTPEMCLAAVGRDGRALEFVPGHLCTKALCLAAVGGDGWALEFVPERLRTKALCLAAVGRDGRLLWLVPEHLCTEALFLVAVCGHGYALRFIPGHLRTSALYLAAVKQCGTALMYVPEHLRTDEILLAAVMQNEEVLDYVPEHSRTEAMCMAAVGRRGNMLMFVPAHLCTAALCMAAVAQDGWALRFIPEHLCTEEIYVIAVGENADVLGIIPEHLRTEAVYLAAATHAEQSLFSIQGHSITPPSHDHILDDLECSIENSQLNPPEEDRVITPGRQR